MASLGLLFLLAACVCFWLGGVLYARGRKRSDAWGIAASGGSLAAQAILALLDRYPPPLLAWAALLLLSVLWLWLYPFCPQLRERLRHL